jgi:hypothetical protein
VKKLTNIELLVGAPMNTYFPGCSKQTEGHIKYSTLAVPHCLPSSSLMKIFNIINIFLPVRHSLMNKAERSQADVDEPVILRPVVFLNTCFTQGWFAREAAPAVSMTQRKKTQQCQFLSKLP